jgi:hypothetical protein
MREDCGLVACDVSCGGGKLIFTTEEQWSNMILRPRRATCHITTDEVCGGPDELRLNILDSKSQTDRISIYVMLIV